MSFQRSTPIHWGVGLLRKLVCSFRNSRRISCQNFFDTPYEIYYLMFWGSAGDIRTGDHMGCVACFLCVMVLVELTCLLGTVTVLLGLNNERENIVRHKSMFEWVWACVLDFDHSTQYLFDLGFWWLDILACLGLHIGKAWVKLDWHS